MIRENKMPVRPLVSVCLITYQHGKYIRECLENVYAQVTDFPFEVLIGEDDSTDGTREICIKYAERYPNITRLFLHERGDRTSLDPSAPWRQNFLNNVVNARGRYIALLEGDDYWTDPLKLQKQIDVMESDTSISGAFHDWVVLDEDSGAETIKIGKRRIDRRANLESVIREKNMSTASMVFRNDIDWSRLPDWFFNISIGDYGIVLLVAQRGDWFYLEDVMSVFRHHNSGIWSGSSSDFRFNEHMKFWNLLAESGEFRPNMHAIKRRRKELFRARGIELGRRGEILPAVFSFVRGIDRRESRKIISRIMRKSFLLASAKRLFGLNRS